MVRITVCLQDDERIALLKLARKERREPRSQAAVLIRNELKRCGLLVDTAVAPQKFQSDETGGQDE